MFISPKITRKGVCLRFKMKQDQIVENIQPASVKVYDYYETGDCKFLFLTSMHKILYKW